MQKWAYHVRVYAILERVLQGIYAVFRQNARKRTFEPGEHLIEWGQVCVECKKYGLKVGILGA